MRTDKTASVSAPMLLVLQYASMQEIIELFLKQVRLNFIAAEQRRSMCKCRAPCA